MGVILQKLKIKSFSDNKTDVGDDPELCLRRLVEEADGNIEKAEHGIIFLDEIDKLSRKGENVSITRDVSGEDVQQALLKMVEGNTIEVPEKGQRKHPNAPALKIDTSNILFICGGAFEGIEKIISKRIKGVNKIGFDKEKNDKKTIIYNELIDKLATEDLSKFGMIPELLGRFSIHTTLHQLEVEDLVRILTETKSSTVKQYQKLFKTENIDLVFEKEALEDIAKKAIEKKVGARGLRSILDKILCPYMYNMPELRNTTLTITNDIVNEENEDINICIQQ